MGVKENLLDPTLIQEFEDAFYAMVRELSERDTISFETHQKSVRTITQQIERIVDSITAAWPMPSLTSCLKELESKKADLLKQTPTEFTDLKIPLPQINLVESYRKRIDHLQDHLTKDPELKVQAAEQFRSLIKSIDVHPLPGKGNVKLKITGAISALALLDQPGQ
jgi:uncharacterized membrane-anchored protein YjiN (DUF445 family)